MNWLQLLPLLVVILFIAKWERDKVTFNRQYGKAYLDGVTDGLRAGSEQWEQNIQHMAKDACAELVEKYPIGIKVIKQGPYKTGNGITRTSEIVELPTLSISMRLHPVSSQHYRRYQDWDRMWKKL